MSKRKEKTNFTHEYPEIDDQIADLELGASEIIRAQCTELRHALSRNPTTDEVMVELAMRLAAIEQADDYACIECMLRGQDKKSPKLDKSQKEADKIWANFPKLSNTAMGKRLSRQGFGSAEDLRKNLVKPPIT